MALFNLARMTVSNTGTGTIQLNSAVTGFLTFDAAGCSTAATGQAITYAIADTNASEIGTATYFSSSLQVRTRAPYNSTNSNNPINMTAAAQVFITPSAADISGGTSGSSNAVLYTAQSLTAAQQAQADTNISAVSYSSAQSLTASQQNQAITNINGYSLGCGRLAFSNSTLIIFSPYNGDMVKISGITFRIPSGGVSAANSNVFVNGVAGQNLVSNTLYYVYLFSNAGVLTIDFSTTGHVTDTTTGNVGVEIKSGNNTRSLIGMVRTNASAQFFDDGVSNFGVATWFNRRTRAIAGTASGITAVSTAAALAELSIVARVGFTMFSNEDGLYASCGGPVITNSVGANIFTNIGLDGSATSIGFMAWTVTPNGVGGGNFVNSVTTGTCQPSEGYHFITPLARTDDSSPGSANLVLFGTFRN